MCAHAAVAVRMKTNAISVFMAISVKDSSITYVLIGISRQFWEVLSGRLGFVSPTKKPALESATLRNIVMLNRYYRVPNKLRGHCPEGVRSKWQQRKQNSVTDYLGNSFQSIEAC